MKVFVDADSCPVKQEIVNLVEYYHLEVIFVASYTHMKKHIGGKWKYVDTGKEEADFIS